MKFYLSSYRLAYQPHRLADLLKPVAGVKKIALIANALDAESNYIRVIHSTNRDKTDLEEVGISVELLDLKNFFNKPTELEKKLSEFSGVYVRGGNVFVLRQAFNYSGFDKILLNYLDNNQDFVYAGYSAGICVLSKDLTGLEMVDNKSAKPVEYPTESATVDLDQGLGILPYSLTPHFRSDHPKSQAFNKVIDYFLEEKVLFMALKDGEVLLLDSQVMGEEAKPYEVLKTSGTYKN